MQQPSNITFTLSIVSHGQAGLIRRLLEDLGTLGRHDFEVVLTHNIPEDESGLGSHAFPMTVIRNERRKGFGANHNAAFAQSRGRYFGVVNPDVRCPGLDLELLQTALLRDGIGVCGPLVVNGSGGREDSARRFPTLRTVVRRAALRERQAEYAWTGKAQPVDWVAGMFMLFRREAYASVKGFDAQRFFMYYEDVDICARLLQHGWSCWLEPGTRVVHDAQRASHRNFRHLRWHATSALRYLTGW